MLTLARVDLGYRIVIHIGDHHLRFGGCAIGTDAHERQLNAIPRPGGILIIKNRVALVFGNQRILGQLLEVPAALIGHVHIAVRADIGDQPRFAFQCRK